MATSHRSPLELADMVEVTERSATGGTPLPEDVEKAAQREASIAALMVQRSVPKAIAVIMHDKGYSRGTAFRIWNDEQKRLTAAREKAHAELAARQPEQAAKPRAKSQATA